MRTYQVRTYVCDNTKIFNQETAELRDIIEFTLENPPNGDQPDSVRHVFRVLEQWRTESGQDAGAPEVKL